MGETWMKMWWCTNLLIQVFGDLWLNFGLDSIWILNCWRWWNCWCVHSQLDRMIDTNHCPADFEGQGSILNALRVEFAYRVLRSRDGGDDLRCRSGDMNGEFTVSATYHLLRSISYINNHEIWNQIWQLRVQERVQVFYLDCFAWMIDDLFSEKQIENWESMGCAFWNWSGNNFTCTKGLSHWKLEIGFWCGPDASVGLS